MENEINIVLETDKTPLHQIEAERLVKALEREANKSGIRVKSYTYTKGDTIRYNLQKGDAE